MTPRRWAIFSLAASLAIYGLGTSGFAQEAEAPGITLESLRTPVSPAFVLLGVEPTSIERPTTPKAVALNILSAARESDDLVPRNYALEVAPYWLVDHEDLTFSGFYRPDFWQGILQSTSLSLATKNLENDTDGVDGTAAGLGMRTQLVTGRPRPKLEAVVQVLGRIATLTNFSDHLGASLLPKAAEQLAEGPIDFGGLENPQVAAGEKKKLCLRRGRADEICKLRRGMMQDVETLTQQSQDLRADLRDVENEKAQLQSRIEALVAEASSHVSSALESIETPLANTGIDCVDLLEAPADPCEDVDTTDVVDEKAPPDQRMAAEKVADLAKKTVALTDRYVRELKDTSLEVQEGLTERIGWHLELAAAASMDVVDEDFDDAEFARAGAWLTPTYRVENPKLDLLGVARYLRDQRMENEDLIDLGGRLIWHVGRLAVSGEALYRIGASGDGQSGDSERVVAMLEYRLTDNLYLVGTFGKDFETEGIDDDPLISILGINFGFGKAPTIAAEASAGGG